MENERPGNDPWQKNDRQKHLGTTLGVCRIVAGQNHEFGGDALFILSFPAQAVNDFVRP
jgi:hypothetical protein